MENNNLNKFMKQFCWVFLTGLVIGLFFSGAAMAGGTIATGSGYYVSIGSGSDTADGSQAAPWKTLHYALSQMSAGGTLYVEPGIYSLANGEVDELLSVPAGVAIVGSPGAVIDGTGASSVWWNGLDISVSDVRVQGLEIKNFSGGAGIQINNSSPDIDGNIIHACNSGISIWNTNVDAGINPVIENNLIYAFENVGIGGESETYPLNPKIYHNTIDGISGTTPKGISLEEFSGGASISITPEIRFNIITNINFVDPQYPSPGDGYAIYISDGFQVTAADFGYNDFYGNGDNNADNYYYNGSSQPLRSTDITADPSHVNLSGGDYHLDAGSPCIDKIPSSAEPNPPVDHDLDGVPRPQGTNYDMGCYEYQGSGVITTGAVTWDGNSDGDGDNSSWDDPNNWDTDQVPGTDDIAVIDMDGTYTVTLGSDVTVKGIVLGASGNTGTQTLNITNHTLTLAGISTVWNADISGTGNVYNNGTVLIYGSVLWDAGFENGTGAVFRVEGSLSGDSATAAFANGFDNYGTIELVHGPDYQDATLNVTSGILVNKAGASITTLTGSGSGQVFLNAEIDNQGILTISDLNPLDISKDSAHHVNSGIINMSGNLNINQSGASPSFANTGIISIGSGTILYISAGEFLNSQGGMIQGNGSIDVSSPTIVQNSGIVSPGMSPGELSITGDAVQDENGSLEIEIGGPNDGDFDRLNLTGNAAMGGTLDVSLINSYDPQVGTVFRILSYGSHNGTYGTVNLPPLSQRVWKVNRADTFVELSVAPDTDGDTLDDNWENQYFGNLNQSPSTDYDNDGLSDGGEYLLGTLPNNPDSDNDGYIDGEEVAMHTDPLDETSKPIYQPGDYYVDANQAFFGNGTQAKPWNSLHASLFRINGGAAGPYTLHVLDGTYDIAGHEPDEPLTVTQPNVTIAGEASARPVLDGTNTTQWLNGLDIEAAGVVVRNLEIQNFGTGIFVPDHSPVIEKNNIHDNLDSGIGISADSAEASPVIMNNLITFTGNGTGNQVGISISAYTAGSNPMIIHNTMDGGDYKGIYISVSAGTSQPVIAYNIITNFAEYGIYKDGGADLTTFTYNDLYGNGANYGGAVGDRTGTGGNISEDPLYPAIYSGYDLMPGSPCIDAVPESGHIYIDTEDYSGTSRPVGDAYDMGAYETAQTLYDVSFTAGTGGTLSGETQQSVIHGQNATQVTAVADTGYEFANWTDASGAVVGTNPGLILTGVTSDIYVTANFEVIRFTVTPSAGAHGSINPSTAQTVNYGDTEVFTVTPADHYHIDTVTGCGGSLSGNTYTTGAVTADCSVDASFAVDTFIVTANAGSGGSVSPSGTVSVDYGASRVFTISADANHHVLDVLVDGSSVGAVTRYTFTNVTENHTISASFAIDQYTITATAGSNGSISPGPDVSVNAGDDRTFTITANLNYQIDDVLVDGSSVGAVSSYSFADIMDDHTIEAFFVFSPGIYYVDSSNTDAGDGSSNSPWQSLHHAVDMVNSGAPGPYTIYVNEGTYSVAGHEADAVLMITQSQVTIEGRGNTRPVIDGDGASSWADGIGIRGIWVTVAGLDVRNFTNGIYVQNVSPIIERNRIYNSVSSGILVLAASPVIRNNLIVFDSNIQGAGTGIELDAFSGDAKPMILHNTIDGGAGYGVRMQEENSWVADPVFAYNIVTNFGTAGLYKGSGGVSVISYNDIYGNINDYAGSLADQTGISGNISLDPMYGGYTLLPGSPCIDAVPESGHIYIDTEDYSGTSRPVGDAYDMGAYETAQTLYDVSFTAGTGGSLSGSTSQSVAYGRDAAQVTAVADTGYEFVNWTDANGGVVGANPLLVLTGVTSDIDVTANFAVKTYEVTFTAGYGGTLSGSTSQSVAHGGDATQVTAVADTGYEFVNWTDANGGVVGTNPELSLTDIVSDMNVTANFEATTVNLPPVEPALVSPVNNVVVPEGPVTLDAGPYSDSEGDAHVMTYWQIRRYDQKTWLYDTSSASDLTSYVVNDLSSGVKYAWRAGYRDAGSGLISWSAEETFIVGESRADTDVPPIPPGFFMRQYKMVSFVQWLDDPSLQISVGPILGANARIGDFKIGAYDPVAGTYSEYPDFKVRPGRSYWFLVKKGMTLRPDGVPVSTTTGFYIDLAYNPDTGNGWNMIASPNKASYLWKDVLVVERDDAGAIIYGPVPVAQLPAENGYIDTRIWRWESGVYDSNDSATFVLKPYGGAWVRAKRKNISLYFSPDAQYKTGNLVVMMRGLSARGKNWITRTFLSPQTARADGDSPPMPMAVSGAPDTGSGGSGCFVSTAENSDMGKWPLAAGIVLIIFLVAMAMRRRICCAKRQRRTL